MGGEYAIETFEAEGAFSVEEVGDVSLLKICGAGKSGASQYSALDSAKDFQPKILMERLKLHIRNIALRYLYVVDISLGKVSKKNVSRPVLPHIGTGYYLLEYFYVDICQSG